MSPHFVDLIRCLLQPSLLTIVDEYVLKLRKVTGMY